MSKMSIDVTRKDMAPLILQRRNLSGATMGTRYSAAFYAPVGFATADLGQALSAAVDEVDRQMSNWNEASDLARLNRATVGSWVDIPDGLHDVLTAALDIERQSAGAFNVAVGEAVSAWGFGPPARQPRSRRGDADACPEPSLHLELERGRALKHRPMTLDLSGIAKGFGVDRMASIMDHCGLASWLVGIDGEMRARGRKPDGSPWAVGHEKPDRRVREPMGVIELEDMSVATSGNYRHWREVDGESISHTIVPSTGHPLRNRIASVTVLAPTCMAADAWATALMVLGPEQGGALASSNGFDWIVVLEDDAVVTSL